MIDGHYVGVPYKGNTNLVCSILLVIKSKKMLTYEQSYAGFCMIYHTYDISYVRSMSPLPLCIIILHDGVIEVVRV